MEKIEFVLTIMFIFCMAVCGSLAADYIHEGKSFRFGLALSATIYFALLMNNTLFG